MGYYAFLDKNNLVTEVIVGVDETELIEGKEPETWYGEFRGQTCKLTRFDGSIRKNFAGKGYKYDPDKDAFIPPKPFRSWELNEQTCNWEAPINKPNDGKNYQWSEFELDWVEVVE